ncbi:MAG TPA: hypothetical protein VKO18_20455 [Terriglobia bacterium]|nr:hypothetical protein [Terriglobia bacterium]
MPERIESRYDGRVLPAPDDNGASESREWQAQRVVREFALPPVFGKENAAGSKHELVLVFGASEKTEELSARLAARAAGLPPGLVEPCCAIN